MTLPSLSPAPPPLEPQEARALPAIDTATLAAIAAITYALANVLHEGVGHGLTCVLVGGRAEVLSTVHFQCGGVEALSAWSRRAISAGGTLVNMVAGAVFWLAMMKARSATLRFFFWLSMTVNLLAGFGYLMVPTAIGFGDWMRVLNGLDGALPVRITLVGIGTAGWVGSAVLARRRLEPFLHRGPVRERRRRARRLSLFAYLFGCSLKVIAGVFNPVGWKLMLMSALAASLGATAALPSLIPDPVGPAKPWTPEVPLGLPRSRAWLVAGAIVAALFVGVIGPGIHFE
jgi:hypothetical protein